MANKTSRGDALAVAQVTRVPAPAVIAGQILLTINDKSLLFDTWDIDAIVDGWNGDSDPVQPASQSEEFSDVTASADGNDLILTADTPGKPFFVTATMAGLALTNEIQTISIGHAPTGGTFTLTFGANTTAGLAFNASAATVQTALQGLTSIGAGNCVVTGAAGGPWTVTFQGALAGQNLAMITANAGSLTGGDSTIPVETLVNGSVAVNEVQSFKLNGTPTGGTFTLSFGGQTTGGIAFNANAAAVQAALVALASIGAGNVSCGGGALPGTPVTVTFQGALAGVDVPLLVGDATGLTGSALAGSVTTTTPGVLGNDLIMGLTLGSRFNIGGGNFLYFHTRFFNGTSVETGTIDVEAASSAADIRAALEQLPSIGAGNVTVTGGPVNFQLTFVGALHASNPTTALIRAGFLTFVRDPTNANGAFENDTPFLVQVDSAGTNEVQRITIAGTPTTGSFTLTFNGQTTAPIAFNASNATVVAALNALSNVGAAGVTGGGGALPGTPVDITFSGHGLQATDVPQMTIDITGLKSPVIETTKGVPGVNELQRLTINGNPFGGTFTITIGAATTAGLAYNISNGSLDTALEGLAGIGAGKVTITGGPLPGTPVIVAFDSSLGNVGQMVTVNSLNNGTVSIAETVPGGATIGVTEVTRSQGPNHWDTPSNWYPHGIPDSGDNVELAGGVSDILYGLAQRSTFTADAASDTLTLGTGFKTFQTGQKVRLLNAGGALPAGLAAATDYYVINAAVGGDSKLQLSGTLGGAAVNITGAGTGVHTIEIQLAELRSGARFTKTVGLPETTDNGNREYRPTYLQLGATSLVIGSGEGTGSGRLKIDTGADQATMKIVSSGGSIDGVAPAVCWKGTHAGSTLQILNGDFGSCIFPGETATLAGITQRGGNVELGRGVTVTGPVERTGGILLADEASLTGLLSLKG